MYHLWFLTCDAHLGTARVEGHTAWKNPNGYLPGMMAPNLPFFAAMSVSYVCLSVAERGRRLGGAGEESILTAALHCADVCSAGSHDGARGLLCENSHAASVRIVSRRNRTAFDSRSAAPSE